MRCGTRKAPQAAPSAPVRPLRVIAAEISRDWTRPYFGAVPYIDAMRSLESMSDDYGMDPASDIVARFLCNATTWRGERARAIKAELNALLRR